MSTVGAAAEDRAAEVVREYLRFHGYANTLKCIEAERLQQHPEHATHPDHAAAQADMKPPLASRMLLPSMVALMCCLVLNQFGLFVPLVLMGRNCVLSKTPREARPKYPMCSDAMLSSEMTIVVTVKDACSQAPGFIRGLEKFAPPGVHLIYTYPDFESCRSIDLKEIFARWDKVTVLPLPLRSSPMQGWLDAVPHIETEYALLLHNDGYALDDFFGCELLQALKARQPGAPLAPNTTDGARYVAAAPMLFESKHDGSLAAHATGGA